MRLNVIAVFAFIYLSFAQPQDASSRVYDKPLSDAGHFSGADHNSEYDHEAFLGKEESDHFAQLTPEESKKRLLVIFVKMDTDNDKHVSFNELRMWLKYISDRYVLREVEKTFQEYSTESKTDYVTFEQHKKKLVEDFDDDDDETADVQKAIARDLRRFQKADVNSDGKLTKEEFGEFLHPEESDRMRDIVIDETMEDLDSNGDGVIDLEEYTNDMYEPAENKPMPDWVQAERTQFEQVRDKDANGFMDKNEIREWLFPNDYNHLDTEAKHLITESDDDRDGVLSRDEVVSHFDLFVGSQATDFGKVLHSHEEL